MTNRQKEIVKKFDEWGITDNSTDFCIEATAKDMKCSADDVADALYAEHLENNKGETK